MALNISKLKKLSSSGASIANLAKTIEQTTSPSYSNPDEDKYWQPTVDKAGNGFAVIRFLPSPDEDNDAPFVKMWNHGFQGPTGQWYIENCLSTIGKDDPVNEFNNKLWNSVSDDKAPEREQVRKQKRKLSYVSNIYIVEDPANPENNGKVFLFKYGKKIFDKVNDAINPPVSEYEQVEKMDPFDLWKGANFRLRIRKVDGYRNYDKSDFDDCKAIFDDDSKIETELAGLHSLQEIVAPDKFKSYDELKAKLYKVLNLSGISSSNKKAEAEEDVDLDMSFLNNMGSDEAKEIPSREEKTASSSDEDDDLEFFKNLRG